MIWLIYIFAFAIGACIGSFLNVVIYRLPREMSIVNPPSHCPACGQPLSWHDNVPIVSFLLLGGRCRHCGVMISGRYALVEALTGILFLATVHGFIGAETFTALHAAVVLIVASALVASSFIDIERRIIPDEITLPGIVLGCLTGLMLPRVHDAADPVLKLIYDPLPLPVWGLVASLFGALAGGGFIYLSGVLGRIIFRKEAMGMGDVKLMAMVGAFLGWKVALAAIFLGCLYGAVLGVALIVARSSKDTRIPFGPYLAMGVISAVFFNAQIAHALSAWQRLLGAV